MRRIGSWSLAGMAVSIVCVAAPITKPAELRGCVTSSEAQLCGGAGTGNANFLTGFTGNENGLTPNIELRSFFRFDLNGINTPVTTASMEFGLAVTGIRSVNSSETFGIFDYLLNPASLGAGALPAGSYADVGTGTLYGSGPFTLSDEGTTVTINLNAAAVTAINAALGGKFVVGGAITSLAKQTDQRELLFASSLNSSASRLVLGFDPVGGTGTEVPEPGTAVLLTAGIAVMALAKLRRR